MDKLNFYVNKLLNHGANSEAINEIYYLCAYTNIDNIPEDQISAIINEIVELIKRNVLKKDLVYFSLISNANDQFLKSFINYEINQPLNIQDHQSLFNYTYYKKGNWLEHVTDRTFDLALFKGEIKRQIEITRILRYTNADSIEIATIEPLLEAINLDNLDEFLSTYLNEITHILSVIKFCKLHQGNDCNLNDSDLFVYISKNKLLNVFCKYLKLSDKKLWNNCLRFLEANHMRDNIFEYNQENEDYFTDTDHFKAFTIIFDAIECINLSKTQNTQNLTQIVDKTKENLLKLPTKVQIEVLENIFTLCFLRSDHFNDHETSKQFLCADNELRLILFFIKSCIEDTRKLYINGTNEYLRLNELKKYISDGLWRLEMLTELEKGDMTHMLSKPDYLIKMCLKHNRFDKVHQVIHIFNLNDEKLTHEIVFTENMNNLRSILSKSYRMRVYEKELGQSNKSDHSLAKILNNFNSTQQQRLKNNDLFDIALTLPHNYETTKELLQELEKNSSKNDFYCKLVDLFNAIGEEDDLCLKQLMNNPKYNLDLAQHENIKELYINLENYVDLFYKQLITNADGSLSNKHPVHKVYMSINDLLVNKSQDNELINYFMRLFNYLKGMLKIFSIEGNHLDILSPNGKLVSYFEILNHKRSDIMRKLIFERNLDPRDFDYAFSKLKLDLLYHTAINCFPYGDITTNERVSIEKPNKDVFTYIKKRNWLIAFIIGEMFELKEWNSDVSPNRTKYLTNYLQLPAINNLKILFDQNPIKTILHKNYLYYCIDYLNKNVFVEPSMPSDAFETAQEIFEDDFKCNWRFLLELCESVPEYQTKQHCKAFDDVKDRILCNLLLDKFELEHYKYVQYMKNDSLRIEMILKHFRTWPGKFCIDLLHFELGKMKYLNEELVKWLKIIEFCETVKETGHCDIWSEMHDFCLNHNKVVLLIMTIPKVNLLLSYCDLYNSHSTIETYLTKDYIESLFYAGESFEDIELLFNRLSKDVSIKICLELLKDLKNLNHLEAVSDYLLNNIDLINENQRYLKNIQISLKILECFALNELEQFWCLISEPLNILETLLMNTKLDKVGSIINTIKNVIPVCELNDNDISMEAIDALLRKYAEKSLEFRIVLEPHPKFLQASNFKLMESLDSLYGPDRKCFVMPDIIPTKSQWIPNNEVLECMCCQNITFSMFNRRHHCRRCGRIVCFNCSNKRMLVPMYGDILVRVCNDCYDQSHVDSLSDNISAKSIMYDFWLLSDDENHNTIVRQEFSYEHAPSVSLCLSIMKHHSKTANYPKFLLDQCNKMMHLLQPIEATVPQEVDYTLVIKMLKSLAIAAKMLSSECHLQSGTSQADRILSQTDLFGLLIERGCLNLLPHGVPYIDATILRKLRDKLLEMEQWNFALDVSTKAGLDNSGVFVAWGKSYLKAGRFHFAREKFQRCLDKGSYYDFYQSSETDDKTYSSRTSISSDNKPTKNSPLLNQIIQILESQTIKFDSVTQRDINLSRTKPTISKLIVNDPAICIKSKLRNLKAIAQGNYTQRNLTSSTYKLEPVFFNECIYYLKKYGSHLSLLQFYVKYNCISETLHYIADNNVSIDIFIEIYVMCLKHGKINEFLTEMSTIDSTLEIWKEYLRNLCIRFEQDSYLNSLYQLQQYMGDYVRASMTCIKFYKDNVKSFKELLSNKHYLQKAEQHLRQELDQQQWVEVNAVAGKFDDFKSNFEEKGLANSLVMKIGPRDIDKHITTIKRQFEITNYLAEHELDDKYFYNILPHITPTFTEDIKNGNTTLQLPTLFGSQIEKIQLAVLAIIAGDNIETGYGLAVRIIHDYKLKPIKVYCQSGRQLARENRYNGIAQLVNCIRSNGTNDTRVTDMCDEMLALAVRTLSRNGTPTSQLENLIKLITDKATKISIYIETKQLKSAYLLAAKYSRIGDIRRILREAEMLNKPDIRKLCQKLLQTHSHSHKDT